jgi:hypothetical protein
MSPASLCSSKGSLDPAVQILMRGEMFQATDKITKKTAPVAPCEHDYPNTNL